MSRNKLNLGMKECLNCSKQIKMIISRDITRKNFCSRNCKAVYQLKNKKIGMFGKKHKEYSKEKIRMKSKNRIGELSPMWKGGRNITSLGYVIILVGRTEEDKNPYVMEHRLVMENHLKRKLLKEEVVHHINGIKTDNRIENLRLFNNQSEHRLFHIREKYPTNKEEIPSQLN